MLKKKYHTEDDDKEDLFLDESPNDNEDWPDVDHLDADEDGYIGNDLEKEGIHSYPTMNFEDDFDYQSNLGDYDNFDYPDDDSEDEIDDESEDSFDEEDDEDDDDYDFYNEEYPPTDENDDFPEYLDYDEDEDNELFQRARRNKRHLEDEMELDFDYDDEDEG
jgi:hypothetical protein